jgi:hypothetical protein
MRATNVEDVPFPPNIPKAELHQLLEDVAGVALGVQPFSVSDTLKTPVTDEQMDELRRSISVMQPFVIEYGPLRTFPHYPGVAFDIKLAQKFLALREAIHSTSLFSNSPRERKEIPPHMTIAEFGLKFEESETLCQKLARTAPSANWIVKACRLRFQIATSILKSSLLRLPAPVDDLGDHVCRLLADHDRRGVGVAGNHGRHDRGVGWRKPKARAL